jgi:cAMP-dependent protein kinase regulator
VSEPARAKPPLDADAVLPDVLDLADALVARGELDRAEAVLREQLLAHPDSLKLQECLANLLIRTGKVAESVALLDGLATACARAGMPGRAIAALKKLARFHPEALRDAGRRIAELAKLRDHEAVEPSATRTACEAPDALPREGTPRPAGRPDLAAASAGSSPLFGDFSADELAAVIHGLDLYSLAPGDLVVSQGEPGRSLFVVVSGTLKVWVREGEGRSRPVRSLGEGDFFGEVSLLTGRPRTATVTAATRADLLELGWSRVEEIVRDHPRVADVLRAFCDERLMADRAAHAAEAPGSGAGPGGR